MKAILFGDLHLGIKRDSVLYHEVCKNYILEIVDYATKKDIKNIICLGDFFDNRNFLNIKTLNAALDIAEMLKNFNVYLILGNHDAHHKNVNFPHSLSMFNEYKNIAIIDEIPLVLENCTLVPWGFKNFKEVTTEFLFGHFDIMGFKLNDSSICYEGHDEKEFASLKHVYSGHFHLPSTKENITYLGSGFQHTFADANSSRGFYEFENGELEFVEFKEYPHFYIFKHDSIDFSLIEGNYVKIVFDEVLSAKENTEILENVLLRKPLELSTEYKETIDNENVVNDSDVSEIQISTYDLCKTYISKIDKPSFINEKTLDKILQSLLVPA